MGINCPYRGHSEGWKNTYRDERRFEKKLNGKTDFQIPIKNIALASDEKKHRMLKMKNEKTNS